MYTRVYYANFSTSVLFYTLYTKELCGSNAKYKILGVCSLCEHTFCFLRRSIMSKIGAFFGKIGSWVVANKAKSIIIGSAAAVAIGGTATGIAIATSHEHEAFPAIIENYVGATCEKNGSYDEVVYCGGCGKELDRTTIVIESSGHPDIDLLLDRLNATLNTSNAEIEKKLNDLKSEYQAKIDALTTNNASLQRAIDALKTEYLSKVSTLEAKDKETKNALANLKTSYETELAKLKTSDYDNAEKIERLTAGYNSKARELEDKINANVALISSLKSDYELKVTELNNTITENTTAIATNKAELQTKIDNLIANYNSEIENIKLLITALQSTDIANNSKIEELEEKVALLLDIPKYSVTFDANGGNESIIPQTVLEGKKITKPKDPTRDGYTFLGWYAEDEKWSFAGYSVTDDVKLTAKWVSTKILATEKHASLSGDKLNILVKHPSECVDVKNYITYDSNCSLTLYKTNGLTESYTYTRMTGISAGENKAWLDIKYSDNDHTVYEVVIHAIDSVEFKSEGDFFESVEVNSELTVNAPNDIPVSKTNGYEFSHWSVNGSAASFPYNILRDTVFEAVYKPTVYTVTYNTNDGIMPEIYSSNYTVEAGFTLPVPSRALYNFDGWYTKEDFSGEKVTEITIGEYGNKTFYAKWLSATNGIILSLATDGSYYTVIGYEGKDADVVIPEKVDGIPVTAIAESAFANIQTITSVTVPDSVTGIGERTFENCMRLAKVKLGEGISSIPSYIFLACGSLTDIEIPSSITSIKKNAFEDCSNLSNVYITSIENWCSITFEDYSANPLYYAEKLYIDGVLVTELVIPNGVTEISSYAFYGCKAFTSADIGNNVETIGTEAFLNCEALISINIGNSVKVICNSAFSGCPALKSVTIGNEIASIGEKAFLGCTELTGVYITDISKWCEISFSNHDSNPLYYAKKLYIDGVLVTELVIPNGVTEISSYAFYGCTEIKSVTIGESVTSIGSAAFENCVSLTSVTIGNGVTSIDYSAFYGCGGIEDVYIKDIAKWCEISFSGYDSNPLYHAENLYVDGELVTDLVIPDGVTKISSYAFCRSYLTSVIIPDSVAIVEKFAFTYSYSQDFTIYTEWLSKPSGWDTSWNSSECPVFWGYVESDTTSDGFKWVNLNGGVYIMNYSGDATELTIPKQFNGVNVTCIYRDAFYNNTALTSIVIPNSVTEICSYSFRHCENLTSITIPNSVTAIGDYAFEECFSLTVFCEAKAKPSGWTSNLHFSMNPYDIPIVWDCNNNEVANDGYIYTVIDGIRYRIKDGNAIVTRQPNNIKTADIKASITYKSQSYSVTSVDDEAFYFCSSLTNVSIGNNVTAIGDYAFYFCSSLTNVVIGNSVTSIGEAAFYGTKATLVENGIHYVDKWIVDCDNNVTNAVIRSDTVGIADYAFCWSGLTNVTIGNSVTSIGEYAFLGCSNLEIIKYRGTQTQWDLISKGTRWDEYYSNGDYCTINYTITYNYTEE